ncbi:tudor domain-containing protein 7B isoform X1 [Drosophila miranda]|uniref:tudor domain-containing protein 7B isoform X1 n=2 Tax=Drosophila miranda TaxID=7229 RepID=UPI00143F1701|nr:tudor domain-containing protein 7B isoform X1 [Drosophila miranda]
MSSREEILAVVTSEVRALIISGRRPPVPLDDILKDYCEVVGEPLPFRRLGYRSAQDLLEATRNFNFQTYGSTVYITAKSSAKSDHIASMVRQQKSSKSKGSLSRPNPQQRVFQNVAPAYQQQRYSQQQHQQYSQQQQKEVLQKQKQQKLQLQQQQQHQRNHVQNKLQNQLQNQQQNQLHNQLQKQLQQQQENLKQQHEKELTEKKLEIAKLQEVVNGLRKHGEEKQRQLEEIKVQDEQKLKERKQEIKKLEKELEHFQRKAEAKELLDKKLENVAPKIASNTPVLAKDKKQHQGENQATKKVGELEKVAPKIGYFRPGNEQTLAKDKEHHSKEDVHLGRIDICNMNGRSNGNGHGRTMAGKPPQRPILGNGAPHRGGGPGAAFDTPISSKNRGMQQRSSVNDRLKLQQQPAATPVTANQTPMPVAVPITPPKTPETPSTKPNQRAPRTSPKIPKSRSPSKFEFNSDATRDPIATLKAYCDFKNLEQPAYRIFENVDRSQIVCSVTVGAYVYSCYPKEFTDEPTARRETARTAIEKINTAESRQPLAICTLTDHEFIDGLYQKLRQYPNGIIGHKLEEWYEQTFNHHLPSHWHDLVVESSKIRLENNVHSFILLANVPASPKPNRAEFQRHEMPELRLPWMNEVDHSLGRHHDWSMYITHCDSTKQVWARLIDQISSLEKLTMHLNKHVPARTLITDPIEQNMYLVEVTEGWSRVRVLSVDAKQRTCRCHFVDFGDVAQFEFEDLVGCPPQFLMLPAQAICMGMYALEKFADHPHAQAVLLKELAGQRVVARILTTEKQFNELGGCAQGIWKDDRRSACLVGTLYDTSTVEDIHLNDLVANSISRNTPVPMLSPDQKSNPVLISHINEGGDLTVLLRNEDLKFVERSIANTVADIGEKHRVTYSDLLRDRLVFVCDESVEGLKQWYRGMLTTKPENAEEETFDVYYVDDGRLRKTHISNIYRLEANNLALAGYPPLALRVRLHDVPDIVGDMLGRLRGLMPPRSEAILKVMDGSGSDKLPMVNVYVRGQDANAMYMCVNTAIQMEYEMQRITRPQTYDDGGLHFNPNGQLQRRNSFGSAVSSHSSGSLSFSDHVLPVTPPVTPTIKEYEAIPAVGAYFEVRIALSINPGHFAVQPYKCYNQFQHLMKDLQAHCKGAAAQGVQPSRVTIGEAYAAPDSDNVYHRVIIRKIYDEIITVRFVDVGDDGVVACDQLRKLPLALAELPKMAIPAQLYGIQLADVLWTQENCVRFRMLTLGKKFIGIVRRLSKLKDDTLALCLELVDTSTPQDIKLHEILINEKHAQPEPKV